MIEEFAPAKINLYLHIIGREADGYHKLDSLAAFASLGDYVRLETADEFLFRIEGPEAEKLQQEPIETNLVVRVARRFGEIVGKPLNFRLTLVKNLPLASGIGGGSSDAAAALRALASYWGIEKTDPRLITAASIAGQDTPFCLSPVTGYLTSLGKVKGPLLPYSNIVLVNPLKALPTKDVYAAYARSGCEFSKAAPFLEAPQDLKSLAEALRQRGNDLAAPAALLVPEIADILLALEDAKGCLFAQMSGSGATCFGLFADRNAARAAAAEIFAMHTSWWVIQGYIPLSEEASKPESYG